MGKPGRKCSGFYLLYLGEQERWGFTSEMKLAVNQFLFIVRRDLVRLKTRS